MMCAISNWFSPKSQPQPEKEEVVIAETGECIEEPKSPVRILVDNGHGEDTPGKRSPYSACGTLPEIPFYEYLWNREIAVPVVEELTRLRYNAELLVPEIEDISLAERCRRTNLAWNDMGKKNVILLSVHSNAAGNGKEWYTAKAWSAYTSIGQTQSDVLADCLYDAAMEVFGDRKIRTDKKDGDRDWEENFYILKHTACPTVLTENFFYDNIDDVKYILSEEGRKAVIDCHVIGILKYLEKL